MNAIVQVPEEIEKVIVAKKAELARQEEERNRAIEAERRQNIDKGMLALLEALNAGLALVPEWIRSYDATLQSWSEDEIERLGRSLRGPDSYFRLRFQVPGLARIDFSPNMKAWMTQTAFGNQWGDEKPELIYHRDSAWRPDLEYTLVEAKKAMADYLEMMAQYEQRHQAMESAHQIGEYVDEKIAAEREAEAQEEKDQVAELLEALRADPVAVILLEAFVKIREERRSFEAQIASMTENIESIDASMSQRVEHLRRDLRDANNRIQEEEDQTRRLKSDLDDRERRLKKAERGY